MKPSAPGQWFRCVGCGRSACVSPTGAPEHGLPPGAVGHSKPGCALYKGSKPAAFAALNVDAEPLAAPDFLTWNG